MEILILTSHSELGSTGKKTGFWLEEFAASYYVFKDLITGQNPASSAAAAKAVLEVLITS